MKKFLGTLMAFGLAVSEGVFATVITNNVNLITANHHFGIGTDPAGHAGMSFEFVVTLPPFFVSDGDQLITNITFDTPLLIQDTNNGYWSYPGNSSGWERFNFTYWYTNTTSGIGSVSDTNVYYSLTLDLLDGTPVSNPQQGAVHSAGGGITAVYFINSNWTDSYFILKGLHFVSNLSNYQLIRNNGEVSYFGGSIEAGYIEPITVPEPMSIPLMLTGLAALGVAMRKRRAS